MTIVWISERSEVALGGFWRWFSIRWWIVSGGHASWSLLLRRIPWRSVEARKLGGSARTRDECLQFPICTSLNNADAVIVLFSDSPADTAIPQTLTGINDAFGTYAYIAQAPNHTVTASTKTQHGTTGA